MSRKKASEQPDLLTFRPAALPSTTHIRPNPQHYLRSLNSQIERRYCTARGTTTLPQRPSKILPLHLAARQTQIRDSPLPSLRSVGSNSGSRPEPSKKQATQWNCIAYSLIFVVPTGLISQYSKYCSFSSSRLGRCKSQIRLCSRSAASARTQVLVPGPQKKQATRLNCIANSPIFVVPTGLEPVFKV